MRTCIYIVSIRYMIRLGGTVVHGVLPSQIGIVSKAKLTFKLGDCITLVGCLPVTLLES